jgi:hypothetical protein
VASTQSADDRKAKDVQPGVVVRISKQPKFFAGVAVAWIVVLLILVVLWWKDALILGDMKDPVGGILPLIVPWAGALGGAAISLVGTAKHSRDWDDSWNIWHAIRPVSGAVAGTVSFFIVVMVLRTAGGIDESARLTSKPSSLGLFFVIAFVTGFRDSIFLNLIAEVAKVLFSSGKEAAERVSYAIDASEVDFGTVAVGGTSRRTVRVTLTSGGATVLAQDWFSVSGNAFACVELPSKVLGSQYRDIEVSFNPQGVGVVQETLKIDIADQLKEVALKGEGA